jgi:hypothetical protein
MNEGRNPNRDNHELFGRRGAADQPDYRDAAAVGPDHPSAEAEEADVSALTAYSSMKHINSVSAEPAAGQRWCASAGLGLKSKVLNLSAGVAYLSAFVVGKQPHTVSRQRVRVESRSAILRK